MSRVASDRAEHARRMRRRGQTTVQYAFLVAIVVAGSLGMAMYLNRGFQGRLRRAADSIGRPYGPGRVQSAELTTLQSASLETARVEGTGTARTRFVAASVESRTTRSRDEQFTDQTARGVFKR